MAKVDQNGFTPTDLTAYLDQIRSDWSAVFGEDLNFDADTPNAQLTGAQALLLTQLDEALGDLASALDIYQATGQQLDNLCSILTIPRRGAIKSNVNAQVTGSPLAVIAAGAQAKLTTGEVFELVTSVSLDGAGTGTGFFQAVDDGAIAIPVNSLTTIVTPSPGWESVDNSASGATGVPAELDFQYRRRYFATLAINAVTPLDSIIAGVFDLTGVTDVAAVENDTNTPAEIQGVTVPAHSVSVSVAGGDDSEIAAEIRRRKTVGCGTTGDVTESVPVYLPGTETVIQNMDISFYRVSEVPALIDVEISVGPAFPTDGQQQMKADLLAYFNGSDQFTLDFELDGLQIAEDVVRSRLYTPLNRTPGHTIESLELKRKTYPDWLVGTTYEIDDIARSTIDSQDYISIVGSNIGNEPSASPAQWQLLTSVDVLSINLNEKATLTEDDITITTV